MYFRQSVDLIKQIFIEEIYNQDLQQVQKLRQPSYFPYLPWSLSVPRWIPLVVPWACWYWEPAFWPSPGPFDLCPSLFHLPLTKSKQYHIRSTISLISHDKLKQLVEMNLRLFLKKQFLWYRIPSYLNKGIYMFDY